MDRKGVVIILITLALAVSYQIFVAVPKQNEARKKYAEQQRLAQEAQAKAELDARAAEAERIKSLPVNIVVTAQIPNATADTIKASLVTPLEQQVFKLEKYRSIAPTNTPDGSAKITVTFEPGADSAKAREGVQAAVDQIKGKLPAEAKITAVEVDVPGRAATEKPVEPVRPTESAEPAKTVVMTNQSGTVEYLFTEDGGGISTITLKEHFLDKSKGTNVKLNEFGDVPIGALIPSDDEEPDAAKRSPLLESATARWTMLPPDTAAHSVSFERTETRKFKSGTVWNFKVTKKFTLAPTYATRREQLKGEYLVRLDVTYENLGSNMADNKPVPISPIFYLHIGGVSPTTASDQNLYQGFDWWRDGKNTFKHVDWYSGGGWIFKDPPHEFYQEPGDLIRWVGVTSQYFTSILTIPGSKDQSEEEQVKTLGKAAWSHRTDIPSEAWIKSGRPSAGSHRLFQLSAAMQLPQLSIGKKGEAGSTVTNTYQIYAGPREYRRLRLLDYNESAIQNYGAFLGIIPTGPISRLLLNSMNGLYNIVGHYALSIVLLTIILKAILWPLQTKANRSMKKMAALSPQMKELQEKYKQEPQKYQQEMAKLFRKAGVNPLSGCWPILIQIPIFMGFYNMLGQAVELRHQGFLWVSDLSQPDTVGHLFGLPINPLPLLMAVTMLLQMKLAPQGGDPAQRKMMMFMPIIFIVMCYNFASGLALYWTVQNLISIIQLFVNRAKEASQRKPVLVK